MESKLHPTIRDFKAFINKHPRLIEEVRKSGRSWQEYYEKWILLGEDDPLWEQYKVSSSTDDDTDDGNKSHKELFAQLKKLTENVDLNKIQKQAHQLNSTISTIQEALGQFQASNKQGNPRKNTESNFNWFQD
ncbi:YlbD family protein [Virgibacillus byunsanensis]|uniref:YlbD family protein n=1 Tax=Virgibacillus byunsanensis TaxID=570945 RepID=A0ABW3LN57_9BACI